MPKMPGTEIDDIFSGKTSTKVKSKVVPKGVEGKGKPLKSEATQTITMRDGEGKKRKKKKEKHKGVIASSRKGEEEAEGVLRDENEDEKQETENLVPSPMKKPKKRPRDEVEEVVDPSITVKKPRLEKDGKSSKSKGGLARPKQDGGIKGGLEKFKDSRGATGRRSHSSLKRIGPGSEGAVKTDRDFIQENGRKRGSRYTLKTS